MTQCAALLLVLLVACPAWPQATAWPATVDDVSLEALAGDWHEVATYGSWSHRRCRSDTRFHWVVRDSRTVDIRSVCTTAVGQEVRTGRLRAAAGADRGRLAVRFAPVFFAWVPAVWTDHWILAVGKAEAWLLVGDRRRTRLSLLSRFASLDEASFARAIQHARAQGFDIDRLTVVPQREGGAREQ